jgi:hypothetical protein
MSDERFPDEDDIQRASNAEGSLNQYDDREQQDEEHRTTATASRNDEEKSADDMVLSNNDANDEAKSTLTLLNMAQVKE